MSCRLSRFVCVCVQDRKVSRTCLQESDSGTEGGETVTGSDNVGTSSTSVDCGLAGSGRGTSSGGGTTSGCGRLGQSAGAVGDGDGGGRLDGVDVVGNGGGVDTAGSRGGADSGQAVEIYWSANRDFVEGV